jgi:2-methylisocitrate lyase-like PEP mutase family enzyme
MAGTASVLRARVASSPRLGPLVLPGAANALAARVIEDTGFEAVYVSGAGIANTFLGVPDIGLVTLSEVAEHVAAITEAVGLPVVVDADTGFGNAVGVRRAVRLLERAGAAGIQIEDQVFPKRCGHFEGKSVVATEEMVQKVRAATQARRDPDTLVIARTDAAAVHGLDAAIERANAYVEAGADVTFVEAPVTTADLLRIPRKVPAPQLVNLVHGGLTPALPLDQLGDFAIVLFANAALQGAVHGMQKVLGELHRTGSLAGVHDDLASWSERQRVVRKPEFDELGIRYATGAGPEGSEDPQGPGEGS